MEINHYYVSPKEYSRQTGLGIEQVKRLCRIGKIPYELSQGGQYHIKVFKDNCVPYEQYEKLLRENEKLKTILGNISNISKEALDGEKR